jgi:hypothetical protein
MNNLRHTMLGQAMTEFTISAAFVLVPLFIIIPILGKYVDMKHATIQAARYEAWEYTAHYEDLGDESSNFSSVANSKKPVKSLGRVQNESRRRFFSRPGLGLDTGVDAAGFSAVDINPLWRYHEGTNMYDTAALDTASGMEQDLTPDPTGVLSGVLYVLQQIFGAMASVVSAVSSFIGAPPLGFDAIYAEGYFKTTVSVPVAEPPDYTAFNLANTAPLFMTPRSLRMTADAGLLTNGWSAGGSAHAASQSKGLVPTALIGNVLNNPLPLQDIVSIIFISPELGSSSLRFGHMNDDAVHPSKLEGGGDHSCNNGGYCTY